MASSGGGDVVQHLQPGVVAQRPVSGGTGSICKKAGRRVDALSTWDGMNRARESESEIG